MYMSIFLHICIYTDLSVFLHIRAYSCESCAKVKSAASLQVAAPFNCTVHAPTPSHHHHHQTSLVKSQCKNWTFLYLQREHLSKRSKTTKQNIPCHVFIVKHHPAFQLSHNWAVAKYSDFTHFQTFSLVTKERIRGQDLNILSCLLRLFLCCEYSPVSLLWPKMCLSTPSSPLSLCSISIPSPKPSIPPISTVTGEGEKSTSQHSLYALHAETEAKW